MFIDDRIVHCLLEVNCRFLFRVEKKNRHEATVKDVPKSKVRPPSAAPKLDASKYEQFRNIKKYKSIIHFFLHFSYKTMAGSSQYRFGVLAKIVKHMRLRHLDGDDHPLSLDDILDETNQLDIGSSVKNV